MGRRKLTGLAGTLTAAVVIAGAGVAQGVDQRGPAARGPQPNFIPSFKTQGTNNFKVRVEGGPDQEIDFQTRKNHAQSIYRKLGVSSAEKIKVQYPGFGRVNVSFTQTKPTITKHVCGEPGYDLKIRRGVWKGVIKFRGEKGYTRVDKTKARGKVQNGSGVCARQAARRGQGATAHLNAEANNPDRSFGAIKRNDGTGKAQFTATHRSFAGSVEIQRFAIVFGDPSRFTYTIPNQAQVKPPIPFSGKGTLDNQDWFGDLKVRFPGKRVKLTGQDYNVTLQEFPDGP